MSKASTAIAVLAIIACVFGAALVYVLLPSTPNDACWRKTYTSIHDVVGNETWDYFTMTITTDRVATVTVNFSSYVANPASESCDLALKWDGIAYWSDQGTTPATVSNFTQFTSFPAGVHTLTLSLEESLAATLEQTFLEICITYS